MVSYDLNGMGGPFRERPPVLKGLNNRQQFLVIYRVSALSSGMFLGIICNRV